MMEPVSITKRRNTVRRTAEWILSIIAVALGIFGAAEIWQANYLSQNGTTWPVPGLIFIQVVLLVALGFIGTAMDGDGTHRVWGAMPWFASGGLLALGGIGSNSHRLELLLLIIPSLAFFGVSLLADQRHTRSVLNHLTILAFSIIINFGLLVLFVSL